jgi:hypothetical protein
VLPCLIHFATLTQTFFESRQPFFSDSAISVTRHVCGVGCGGAPGWGVEVGAACEVALVLTRGWSESALGTQSEGGGRREARGMMEAVLGLA